MKLMKFAAAAAVILGSQAAAQETLRVGNEGDYPPYSITLPDGTLTGLDPEIVRELCRRVGVTCDIQVMEFSAQLPAIIAGRLDMIGNGMYPRPERMEVTEYLDPHAQIAVGWVVANSMVDEVAPGAFNGMRVGSIEGAAYNEQIVAENPDADLIIYNTQQEVFLDMRAGRVDATYTTELGAAQDMPRVGLSDDYQFVSYQIGGRAEPGNSFALALGMTELRDRMNVALEEMFEDCSYTEIRSEFIAVPGSSREPEHCLQ